MTADTARTIPPQQHQEALLDASLHALFGELEPATRALLREQLQWVHLPGGAVLMTQGEPGDALYIAISGRLRAYVRDADGPGGEKGAQRMVREMARGQAMGEMALFTDEPRSATVVAIRDSVLVRLSKAHFQQLLASSVQVSIALTRQVIRRLLAEQDRSMLAGPIVMGLLPVSAGIDAHDFARQFAQALAPFGRVRTLDAAAVDAALGHPGAARSDGGDEALARRIALLLDHVEAGCDILLLVADDTPTSWTHRCSRHSDERLLLADATEPPRVHANEREVLMQRGAAKSVPSEAAEVLLLLHPAGTTMPRATAAWLARRPVADHLHLRRGHAADLARLARLQTRNAVGLVLAGGGARGFAHLGVWRALKEAGIEPDVVGGTSIGAVMAAFVATDRPVEQVLAVARRAFSINPTGDWNLLPLISLIKGQRLKRVIREGIVEICGAEVDCEDLWKGFFCIATNYSQAREEKLQRGPLALAMRASISIPGALPPVLRDGELYCDGGTFNNFPVDVMRGVRGVGRVIGVDLNLSKPRRIELDELPGAWALLRDRLRPRSQRRYRLPSLPAYLMNVTILYSVSRQRQAQRLTQTCFHPPLERVGLLEWGKFEQIVQQGYEHAKQVLAQRPSTG
jgi:NTE family protein